MLDRDRPGDGACDPVFSRERGERATPFFALALLSILALPWALGGCGGGEEVLHLAGTVERTRLELAAPVSEVIVELPVSLGERVGAAEVVVKLDTVVAEAELVAAEAALAAAEAAVTETQQEFKRVEELRRRRVSSPQDLDRARRARDEALAAVAERQARIAQANKRLEDLTIRSHAAGTVDQLPFETGERVPAGAVVAVVQSRELPWVRIWVPARAVSNITDKAWAEIEVEGLDAVLRGRIEDVSREPEFTPHYALTERETANLVYRAKVVLVDAPADLRPGLPARVELHLPPRESAGG